MEDDTDTDSAPKPKKKIGRPLGSSNKRALEAIETARKTGNGRLPHEILLDMARGAPVEIIRLDEHGKPLLDEEGTYQTRLVIPTLEDMKDAAKAAAPYFAPKLQSVEVIQGVTDDALDAIIARAAAEAGVSLGADGEGEEEEAGGGGGEEPATAHRREQGTGIRRRPITRPQS